MKGVGGEISNSSFMYTYPTKTRQEHLPPHAVFASNTSAIPIARIAEASKVRAPVAGRSSGGIAPHR